MSKDQDYEDELAAHFGPDWAQHNTRRGKAEMADLKAKMQALEAEGKTRKQIALILQCTQAQVTKALGAVRQWMGKRRAA